MNMTHDLKQLLAENPELALDSLAAVAEKTPTAESLELYGHCLTRLNKIPEAIIAYDKALKLDASLTRVHFSLAQLYQKEMQYDKALKHLRPCLDFAPNEPMFLFQVGACYLQLENFPQAKKYLQKALAKQAHHLEALINLGICYLKEKNFDEAVYYLATACRVNEDYAPAQYNLACALMEAKRYPQARMQFEQYLEKHEQDLEARYHLGFVLMNLDVLSEAKNCFQTIVQANSQHMLAMHNLASIALKENEPSVALGYYQRISSCDSQDEIAKYMISALTQKNAPAKAPDSYVKALFDQYAEHFDQHLKESLQYQTPQHLYDLWLKSQTTGLIPVQKNNLSILDLGCGTGLAGELFKRHAKKLIGIDLSPEMLKKAQAKNIYDQLHESEILRFLEAQTERFDLAILADVLVYFGDLHALFAKLSHCAKTILLSIEHTDHEIHELMASGRYRHPLKEVMNVANQYHFAHVANREVVLRMQNHQAVKGEVVLFTCPN
jgi:predicted TPR repeat methyltransferase/cytochrome c-type biogenesis protein CcmH/NrfG